MSRHFHYALVYNDETNTWSLDTYDMGDGDIWDSEEQEWRWADDEVVEGERDLDGKLYDILKGILPTLSTPIITPAGQEPDLIYGNE
jgi:hypothetical protein